MNACVGAGPPHCPTTRSGMLFPDLALPVSKSFHPRDPWSHYRHVPAVPWFLIIDWGGHCKHIHVSLSFRPTIELSFSMFVLSLISHFMRWPLIQSSSTIRSPWRGKNIDTCLHLHWKSITYWLSHSPDIPYKNERRHNPALRGIFLVISAHL